MFFRFDNAFPTREQFIVCLNKAHLVSGRLGSLKNQIAAAFDAWTRPEMGLPAPDPSQPFPDNGSALLSWARVGLDEASGGFLLEGEMVFAYGITPLAVMLLASRPFALRETGQRYLLSVPWEKEGESDEVRAGAVARRQSRGSAGAGQGIARARRAANGGEDRTRGGVCRGGACAGDCPAARGAEFARAIPAFEEAMLLAETPSEACLRAAAHKFGYFAMWDQLYPVKQFLVHGRPRARAQTHPLSARLSRRGVRLLGQPAVDTHRGGDHRVCRGDGHFCTKAIRHWCASST